MVCVVEAPRQPIGLPWQFRLGDEGLVMGMERGMDVDVGEDAFAGW